MCGIAGFYSKSGNWNSDHLNNMTDSIAHRGPDASGHFASNGFFLGHRRLSIIDLSAAANQPFTSACGRYTMIYNGEVFNFKEIAYKLKINPRTNSDTEIVIEAFAKLGCKAFEHFNGMFALAIFDKKEFSLTIARDQLGKKPLYYSFNGENLAFASELKALKKLPQKLSINDRAVTDYLHLGYIPEPHSIYNEIQKFPAGHFGVFSDHQFTLNSYWNSGSKIERAIHSDMSMASERFRHLLEDSVKIRLESDVPFGSFLSGGVDSSIVTAVAAKLSNSKLNTFTIGFSDKKHSEASHAAEVAKFLGTEHHEYILSENETIPLLESILDVYDEPYADSSAIPTMLVSKIAKQKATMMLSGDGGDELFHGYGAYHWANRLNNPLIRSFRFPISYFLSTRGNRSKRAASLFQYKNSASIQSHIFSQEQYLFSSSEIHNLIGKHFQEFQPAIEFNNLSRVLKPAEKQALFDIQFYLKDDLLVKVDRASMRYSLEVRNPLLDHRIVEFALNLDSGLKISRGNLKYFLKQNLYHYIPEKYFDRPKKGFSIPLAKWMKGELAYLVNDYANPQIADELGYINKNELKSLVTRFEKGEDYLYNRIWLIIILHKFMKEHA